MSLTGLLVPTYAQMLVALSSWLDKAQEQTGNADALLSARLAPDMYPLATQIRFACLQAQEAAYRLRGEVRGGQLLPDALEALANEGRNGGTRPGTMADAQARIAEALAFLEGLAPDAMDTGAARTVALELPNGMIFDMAGADYARDWALPQFYFHLMTAYAILRGEGIALGKADYVRHAFAYLRPGTMPDG